MRLVLASLALLLLAPLVGADHVYSHRYVFEGRLVGANGLPIPGRTMEFFASGDDFLEPCEDAQLATTNEWGDFRFCFHKHALAPNVVVGVGTGNLSVRKPVDTAMRRTVVLLTDPEANGTAPAGWNETYRIAGRVWRAGPTTLEGVPVYGNTMNHVPVNVTLTMPDGNRTDFAVLTDGYGDFDATLRLVNNATPDDVQVRAFALGQERAFRLDAQHHRNTVGFLLPDPSVGVAATMQEGPADAPGSAPPGSPALAALVLVAAALTVGIQEWKKRR